MDLSRLSLADASSSSPLGDQIILPGEYMIICSVFDTASYSPFGSVIALNSFPSLNNSTDSVRILGPFGDPIDYVFYDDTWYRGIGAPGNGRTLERIDPDFIDCNNSLNWRGSLSPNQGTPGSENSVDADFFDGDPPQVLAVEVLSSTEVVLKFNEPMEIGTLFQEANFSITPIIGNPFRAIPFSVDNSSVLLSFSDALTPNVVFMLNYSGLRDCAGNEASGSIGLGIPVEPAENDVVFSEIFADPSPPVGLPEVEYVEIFNRTSKIIAFNSLVYQDGNTEVNLGDGFILPRQYVILC
ncbi:MAG: Ig-like domain-containing protein, partial [Bacteroidota bacterium]